MESPDTRGLLFSTAMLGFMVVTLAGAVFHSDGLLIMGGLGGYVAAMVHGIYFCAITFKRKRAWTLQGSARAIHAGALAALVLAVAYNVYLVVRYVEATQITMVVGWSITILVLAYRAWVVPSPRRAGVLQAVAVVIAVPSIFIQVVGWSWSLYTDSNVRHDLDTSMFVYFIVVAATGPVLNRLFASRADPPELPVAVARDT